MFSDQSHLLIIKLPRRQLEARVGKCRQMVARHITPHDAITRLASSHLALLPAQAEPMDRVIGDFSQGTDAGFDRLDTRHFNA